MLQLGLRKKAAYLKSFAREQWQTRKGGVGMYNFWAEPDRSAYWLYQFLQRPTLRRAAGKKRIACFSVFGPRYLVGLDRSDVKLFYTGENLVHYPTYQDHLNTEVDLCLGFDYDPGLENYLRFPLWLQHLVPADFDPGKTHRIENLGKQINRERPYSRDQFACLVARHDQYGTRTSIVEAMSPYGEIDFGGAFKHNISVTLSPSEAAKLSFISNYRYNICPENTNRKGYVTEKLVHAIQAGCIPVYWGSDNEPEPEVFNPAAVLFHEPDQPNQLKSQLEYLESKSENYAAFQQQPRFLSTALEFISDKIRTLERRIIDLLQ